MNKGSFLVVSVIVVLVVFVGLIFEAYWVIAIPAVLLLVKWLNKKEPEAMSPEEWEEIKKRFRKE
jgi:hypothetical protein